VPYARRIGLPGRVNLSPATLIEIAEYPHLVVKYELHGVPHTAINEKTSFVGAAPEMEFCKKVLEAVR
jgi:hypothetical protein